MTTATPAEPTVDTRHRVLLIRPWDVSDGVGAGCCSGGSAKGLCVDPQHHPVRGGTRNIERTGWAQFARVYRGLRASLPADVTVEVVDPRNHLYLLPALIRGARRRGARWPAAVRAALRGPGYAAVIVDGQVVSSGRLPSPDEALHQVRAALGVA
ncbi:thioredoxin family protein [Phytoactinopolyspora limicola]|uniref:thioredoxin family protein n=1 Tax=Phytoactinopolyspora limicola TaxID=2715536 RepID=UPI00140C32BD|nr:thioredoxin family protein [Phytoactinopolyspora limicola]